jgi:hypothetical protein
VLSPDVLVFDTVGNDHLAAREVFDRLASRPPGMALIYFKMVPSRFTPCLPGAVCLPLASESMQTAAVE